MQGKVLHKPPCSVSFVIPALNGVSSKCEQPWNCRVHGSSSLTSTPAAATLWLPAQTQNDLQGPFQPESFWFHDNPGYRARDKGTFTKCTLISRAAGGTSKAQGARRSRLESRITSPAEADRQQEVLPAKGQKKEQKPCSHFQNSASFILPSTSAPSVTLEQQEAQNCCMRETEQGKKAHISKSYLEIQSRHAISLVCHFLHFLLQVCLGCVLDINIVAIWAGKVAAYALCGEMGHRSFPNWLQKKKMVEKAPVSQMTSIPLLPYWSSQQIPSSFQIIPLSVPLEEQSCTHPSLSPLFPSLYFHTPELSRMVPDTLEMIKQH